MMIEEGSDQDIILSIARQVMWEVSERLAAANQKKIILKLGPQVIYEVDRNRTYFNTLMRDPSSKHLTGDERIALRAYIAHETRYGNCGEHAELAYVLLRRKQKSNHEVAVTSLKNDDHAFVTIFTSQDERIIVDPWKGCVNTISANDVDKWCDYQFNSRMDGRDLVEELKKKYPTAIQAIDYHIRDVYMSLEKHEISFQEFTEVMLRYPGFRIYG
ncbi:hypothetical protein [Oscillatoria acuminata]|uniref:hypothetical protein n=1 Tax=Oscillatoria acuminata TaxID=118323 RepID=UPI0003029985|nr:hypothetical protein [Oscillatoria acuminata]